MKRRQIYRTKRVIHNGKCVCEFMCNFTIYYVYSLFYINCNIIIYLITLSIANVL